MSPDFRAYDNKRKLQNLVFPDGILYNKQKDLVRTPRIKSIFAAIPMLSQVAKKNKKGHLHKSDLNSHWVVPTGIYSSLMITALQE